MVVVLQAQFVFKLSVSLQPVLLILSFYLAGDGIVRTLKWLDWHTVFIIASSSATVDQYELGEVVNSALTNDGSFTIVRKKQVESPASSTDVSDTFTLVQTEARSEFFKMHLIFTLA